MKVSVVLQLAAIAGAFVIPDQQALAPDVKETLADKASSGLDLVDSIQRSGLEQSTEQARKIYEKYALETCDSLDEAISYASDVESSTSQEISDSYFDARAWIESKASDISRSENFNLFDSEVENDRPRESRPRHGHKKGNQTLYELIAKSKYTTKLAKLINDYPDLVETLNNTKAHSTVFAPTDAAFRKIPKHAPKPSKEFIKKVLLYHVSPDFYPARRVLASRTIPTLLKTDKLSKDEVSQRLATEVSLKGLLVNFYARVFAINIWASNGVIHAIDSILVPPPPVLKIIDFFPGEFSTLELALFKTGLAKTINETEHSGGTFFAPSNFAFSLLGTRANAFLFSPPGLKYLKALLKYHIVNDQTLYSDYYLDGRSSEEENLNTDRPRGPPRGYKHYDLSTTLEDKTLAVDVSRYGRLIDIRLNGYAHVSIPDGVADDGVIHEVTNVLVPPHSHSSGEGDAWNGEGEIDVDELIERLEPHVDHTFTPEDL